MTTQELIELAGQRLVEAAGSPARVILFGSAARGELTRASDLDFLIIEREVENRVTEAVRFLDRSRCRRVGKEPAFWLIGAAPHRLPLQEHYPEGSDEGQTLLSGRSPVLGFTEPRTTKNRWGRRGQDSNPRWSLIPILA